MNCIPRNEYSHIGKFIFDRREWIGFVIHGLPGSYPLCIAAGSVLKKGGGIPLDNPQKICYNDLQKQ